MHEVKLGVNIDHVATLRNARGGIFPDILRAADSAEKAGAHGITMHLREDRRHVKDIDVYNIKKNCALPLNLEIAATREMLKIALDVKPEFVCIVPEKREELTTEGGLDLTKPNNIKDFIEILHKNKIKTSLFIDANIQQIELAKKSGTDAIEIHTGEYAGAKTNSLQLKQLTKITQACKLAVDLNLICNAGHGLNYDNVANIAKIPNMNELNIGHFIICESIFIGIEQAVKNMLKLMS